MLAERVCEIGLALYPQVAIFRGWSLDFVSILIGWNIRGIFFSPQMPAPGEKIFPIDAWDPIFTGFAAYIVLWALIGVFFFLQVGFHAIRQRKWEYK